MAAVGMYLLLWRQQVWEGSIGIAVMNPTASQNRKSPCPTVVLKLMLAW
jgi:hypothetical protein